MADNYTSNEPDRQISRRRSKSFYKRQILKSETSNLEEQLITCPKCQGIMVDAVVYDGKTTCMECCENKFEGTPAEILRQNIGKMEGKCPFSDQGCGWTGEILLINEHLEECEYFEKKCPFADFGCTFTTQSQLQMETHKWECRIEHYELRLEHLETENSHFKVVNASMKRRIEGLLDRNRISKFVETRKKCLEGVEWRVVPTHTGGQLEGPSFYIRSYHLQLVGKVEDNLKFYVRRIPGEFDESLPPAQLTYSSAEQAGRAKTSNDSHEHKLELYSLSDEIDHVKCSPCIMRFYFDIEEEF